MLSRSMASARAAWVPLARCSQCIASSSRLPSRSLATSLPLSRPAAARLAEVDHDEGSEPYYQHSPPRRSDPSSSRLPGSMPFSNRRHVPLQLPTPLPMDVTPELGSSQATLYPSTGVIDAVSLLSICLRRPEHVPRAYQIFRQLLEDSKTKAQTMPDTEIWAKVIQAMAELGKETEGRKPGEAAQWRDRTRGLIDAWEGAFRSTGLGKLAGREKEGIKVYQGWFAGMVNSETPLEPLAPYFYNREITVSELVSATAQSDLPAAFDALTQLAQSDPELEFIAEQVAEVQTLQQAQQDMVAREVIPEVKPVLETDGRNLLRKRRGEADLADGASESDNHPVGEAQVEGMDEARFAVRNLRSTLEKLSDVAMPAHKRQMELEKASYDAAKEELAHSAELLSKQKSAVNAQDDQKLQRQVLQGWMYTWLGQLKAQLSDDIFALRQKLDAGEGVELDKHAFADLGTGPIGMKDNALALYLTLLPVDKLAIITVIEIMRQSGGHGVADGMKALRAMLAVGKAVETEYRAETIRSVAGVDSAHWQRALDPQTQKPNQQTVSKVWRKLGKQMASGERRGEPSQARKQGEEWSDWKANDKAAAATLEKAQEDDLKAVWTPPWSQMAHLGVGSFLVSRLLQTAKVQRTAVDPETDEEISEEQPAFSHGYDYVRGKKLGVIRLNPVVAKRLSKDDIGTMIHPKHLPMLVEPRPWRKYDDGGYLIHNVPIMRFKDSPEQKSYLKEASEQGHLEPVFHGLDVLSSTPWAINRKVFDIVLEAWNSGKAIADIPAAETHSEYDLPDRPDGSDPQQRAHYIEKAKLALAQSRKDHAERCKYNYNIEIARSYLHETFYLPHSMDFRGRAYPIPPHLSPVGDDLCRGLLTFGVSQPLGKTGLKWLQIHLANLYGFDKASFEDRARFAQDHEADIFDSADRPLEGNRWWLKAEDPWQCLATCYEIAAALRSPNPELYESSLPVHQDGTCNGMQHYAALGGDVRGARAVNLENGDRPADIYTGVADIVNKIIDQDKAEGHPVAALIPSALGRKVVKQTVMTTVYGVTFIGARDQIARQLLARGDVASEHIFAVSAYVAKTVLSCIGDLFAGAKDIMDWLTTSARLVARSIPPERVEQAVQQLQGHRGAVTTAKGPKKRLEKELMTSVIWTTPLGLPVVQPYRKAAKKQVMTALQSVYIADPNAPAEVSPQKQATAFPPNFIHSLDATHMLLTAQKCKQKGMTFSSVHDSYWTHAATVEPMSDLIRDMFIKLHEGDLVGQLRQEFIDRYGDYRIAVQSAQKISTSAKQRKEKDAVRRKALASLLGEEESSAVVEQAMDGDAGATNVIRAMDAKEGDEALDMEGEVGQALEAAESEVAMEEQAEDDGSDSAPKKNKKVPSIALSQADLTMLRKRRDDKSALPEEVISNQRFVKFKDVIPPCPPRGAFDVKRVSDSAYFFS